MKTITLEAGPSAQAVMNIDEDDHIGRFIATGTWYEQDLLNDAFARVSGPGTAIDVGGHIGNHAMWFALACGLDVISLEPNPVTLKHLQSNIDANPNARIRAVNAAVGRRRGHGTSTPPPLGNTGMARFSIDRKGPIPVVKLDSLRAKNVKLIKIDVEGTAADVLRGGYRLISKQSPVIYAEGEQDEIAEVLPDGYECFGRFARTPTWGFSR